MADWLAVGTSIGFLGPHPCFFSTKIGLAENLGRWGLNESPAEPVRQDCLFSVGTCWAVVCQTESPVDEWRLERLETEVIKGGKLDNFVGRL